MNDKVDWQDVEDFIYWIESDEHDFDVWLDRGPRHEFCGYVNIKTGKKYSVRDLFDYWIKYEK